MGQEGQKQETDEIVEKFAMDNLSRIFEKNHPISWRVELISRLQKYDFISEGDIARAEEILDDIESVTEEDVFLDRAKQAMKPLLDHIKNDPIGFQNELQENALSRPGGEQINELLHYHLDDSGGMHLHVLPNMFTSNKEKLQLLRDGMSATANILSDNPDITAVHATSWIVAENPKLLQMLGFSIDGEISDEDYDNLFQGEDRDVWKASISREDFLSRHLK